MTEPMLQNVGIDWITEIPSSWTLRKAKYLFSQRQSKGNSTELQLLTPSQQFGVIPQRLYEELSGQRTVKLNEKTDLSLLKTVRPGDFCISLRSFQGGFEYSNYNGVVSQAYQIFFPKNNNITCSKFYKYLFKSSCFISKMNSYTLSLRDGKNIAYKDFSDTYLPVPPLLEQNAIADFLDSKCAEIDALTADIEKQIETLREYKTSVITEAVTKGLDPNVEMKMSGCNWIGQIPKTWTESKVKLHLKKRTVRNPSPGNTEILSLYREYGVIPKNSRDDNHNVTSADTSKYLFVRRGDFVINKMKAWQGSVALSSYEGIVSPAYFVYEFISDQLDKQYLHYLLRSCYKDEFRRLSAGMREGQWDLSPESFSNLSLILPSLEEQIEISQYLETTLPQIDKLIRDKGNQIETLAQYKQSLIYEYVTGKKTVPNA